MSGADYRLRAADAALLSGFPSAAVSDAYYAALYAARAALSEEERYAKTHRGTWSLFRELFVLTHRVGADLFQGAHRIQDVREAADYDARELSAEEADAIISDARRFVAAVASLLAP